jgi:hypothetical protein
MIFFFFFFFFISHYHANTVQYLQYLPNNPHFFSFYMIKHHPGHHFDTQKPPISCLFRLFLWMSTRSMRFLKIKILFHTTMHISCNSLNIHLKHPIFSPFLYQNHLLAFILPPKTPHFMSISVFLWVFLVFFLIYTFFFDFHYHANTVQYLQYLPNNPHFFSIHIPKSALSHHFSTKNPPFHAYFVPISLYPPRSVPRSRGMSFPF